MTPIAIHSIARFKPRRGLTVVQFGLHETGTTLITNDLLASFRKISGSGAPIIYGTSSVHQFRASDSLSRYFDHLASVAFAISRRRTAVNFRLRAFQLEPKIS